MSALPIEHCWEIRDRPPLRTATHVLEIPPERAESLADTMAPIAESTSVLGCPVPWTLSAWTRRGLECKMRRFERRNGFVGDRKVADHVRSRKASVPLLDVRRVNLSAGDVVAVLSQGPLSDCVAEQIAEQVKASFPDNRVLVFGPEFDLQVVGESDLPSGLIADAPAQEGI